MKKNNLTILFPDNALTTFSDVLKKNKTVVHVMVPFHAYLIFDLAFLRNQTRMSISAN